MKFNFPLNNFGAGEWSPKMQSRTDAEQYPRSCKEITNMLVQMQGGAQYRAGTIRQKFSDTQAIGAMNTLATNAEPTKDFKIIPYINSDTTKNTELMIYFSVASDGFRTPEGTQVNYGSHTNTDSWDPSKTQYQQVGNLLFITNTSGDFKPKVFYWDGTSAYNLYDLDRDYVTTAPWRTIPWGDINALDSGGTITTTGTITGTITLSSSFGFGSALANQWVGRYIRLCNGTALDGVVRVDSVAGGVATCTVLQTIPNASFTYGSTTNASSFWQASAWYQGTSAAGSRNWPKTVVAYQGRVIFGGIKNNPDTIWGSRISNVLNYEEVPGPQTTGVYGFASSAFLSDNSRPFALTPNTSQAANIVAMSASKSLNIHTDIAEIVAYGGNGSALGPNNVIFESSTSFGGAPVQPVRVNNYSTFVQNNGYKVRDLIYNFNEDQYKSQDLGFIAEHMFTRTKISDISSGGATNFSNKFPVDDIIELARYETRSSLLLARTRMGKVYYVTLDRDYSVNAWGRIVLGSETQESYPYDNQPVVLAMCVSNNQAIFLVKRSFGGSTIVTREYMVAPWEYENLSNDTTNAFIQKPQYLDCSYIATNVGSVPTTTWKMGTYLSGPFYSGATLSVVADGSYVGEVTLGSDNDGAFTLARAASQVYVGYKYPGKLKTSGIEQAGQFGPPVGKLKRIHEASIRLHKSGSALFGKDENSLEELAIRPNSTPMGQPTPYFTGNKSVTFPPGYEDDYSVVIIQNKPYPLYIVSVSVSGVSDD